MTDIIFSQFLPLLTQLALGSVGVWGFAELVKKIRVIPINENQKLRIRSFTSVCSLIGGAIVAYSNDSLTGDQLQQAFVGIISFASMWYGSHSIHKGLDEQ